MTWKEICESYPDEWIALVEIDWLNDRDFDFRACVSQAMASAAGIR